MQASLVMWKRRGGGEAPGGSERSRFGGFLPNLGRARVQPVNSPSSEGQLIPAGTGESDDAGLNRVATWKRTKEVASRMDFTREASKSHFDQLAKSVTRGENRRTVIDPRQKWVRGWDAVTGVALLFTALVTIYEVAFLEGGLNSLFWINRGVDCIFLVDLILQFFMMFYDEEDDIWVTDQRRISLTYLKSWFMVDLFSILPFDALGVVLEQDNLNKLKIIRIIKLLRLAKLLRVLRAGRVFQRMEAHINISYKAMQLITFGLGVMLCAHWMACALHLCVVIEECTVASYEDGDCVNWVYNYNANGGNGALLLTNEDGSFVTTSTGGAKENLATTYWTAFYWAMMTMSTIGYGDVTPQTDVERVYVTLGMVVGASIYAYMVGNVCSIIAGMNAGEEKFRMEMDSLNQFMEANGLPKDLRKELRAFYRYRNSNVTIHEGQDVLKTLTPRLQSYVAGYTHASWLQHTDLFRSFPADLVVELCLSMRAEVFTPDEPLFLEGTGCDRLYIVERGLVWYRGCVYGRPNMTKEGVVEGRRPVSHWIGIQDLNSVSGLHRFSARSMTYSVSLVIRRETLESTISRYPEVARTFRRTQVKAVIREIVLLYARVIRGFETNPTQMIDTLYQRASLTNSDNWILKFKLATVMELIIFKYGVKHAISERILRIKWAAVTLQSAFRGSSTRKRITQMMRYLKFVNEQADQSEVDGDFAGVPAMGSISLSDPCGTKKYKQRMVRRLSKQISLTKSGSQDDTSSKAGFLENAPPLSHRQSNLAPLVEPGSTAKPVKPFPAHQPDSNLPAERAPGTSYASIDTVMEHTMTMKAVKTMRNHMNSNFEGLTREVADIKRMVLEMLATQAQ